MKNTAQLHKNGGFPRPYGAQPCARHEKETKPQKNVFSPLTGVMGQAKYPFTSRGDPVAF
ncbi:hypothetical protein [Acetobacter persici]|uniref:hypothetical protein n=1 Tax=Acetobacter persici TaxID=1076596 RepID=UPI001BAE0048|nr:hypothetical protein [Acetobacter persici]MBS0961692.1 hypothetical protein [Acetobacter persici]